MKCARGVCYSACRMARVSDDMDDNNMEFDSRAFYQQIEDEYNVTLRRNVRKSWEDYWAWLVCVHFYFLFGCYVGSVKVARRVEYAKKVVIVVL